MKRILLAVTLASAASALGCAGVESATEPAVRPTEQVQDSRKSAELMLRGARLPGGELVDVEVSGGRFARVEPAASKAARGGGGAASGQVIDARGRWLAPAFIDSHVHLDYFEVSRELAAGGVAAAVDLAAPQASLGDDRSGPLRIVRAGPMLTAPRGYPTRSWGRGGYGLECGDRACAARAVSRLHRAGAGVIKVAAGWRGLAPDVLSEVVQRGHAAGLAIVAHALGRDDVAMAAAAGVDVLAHTPVEPLDEATISVWRGKAVISTISAFGGSDAAVSNLSALRRAGAIPLYGTDLGNTRHPGIDRDEIALLMASGMTGAEILAAATTAPAAFWGLDELGAIAPGKSASFLLLDADPTSDPMTLSRPIAVYIDGIRQP